MAGLTDIFLGGFGNTCFPVGLNVGCLITGTLLVWFSQLRIMPPPKLGVTPEPQCFLTSVKL